MSALPPSGLDGRPQTLARLSAERSTLINRNITVRGRRTSVRLEGAMWEALDEIARRETKRLSQMVTMIDDERSASSLTAAIRVYIMLYYKSAATDAGHRAVGHGLLPVGDPALL